eukprot:4629381-Amphidinium_carterae.1
MFGPKVSVVLTSVTSIHGIESQNLDMITDKKTCPKDLNNSPADKSTTYLSMLEVMPNTSLTRQDLFVNIGSLRSRRGQRAHLYQAH